MKILIAVVLAALAVVVNTQHWQQQRRPVAILRQSQTINPSGHYGSSNESANGISASATSFYKKANNPDGLVMSVRGQFQYTARDGIPIKLTYVADENGFHPQGAHLPVAPPVPKAIRRALEYIRRRQLQVPKRYA